MPLDVPSASVGPLIRMARERRGLAQAQLAERLGRTQTAVSYWESGRRMPGLDDLFEIARALDLRVEDLLPGRREPEAVGMRLRATAERVNASELDRAVDALLVAAEEEPTPSRELWVGSLRPTYAANELLEAAGVDLPPIPIDDLVRRCGVLLLHQPMPADLSGLVFGVEGHAVMGINSQHHLHRQRFSTAHELGHYLLGHLGGAGNVPGYLHVDLDSPTAPDYDPAAEREANEFAADLLMPRRLLAAAFRKKPLAEPLARQFKVSEVAMGYRLINLGLR